MVGGEGEGREESRGEVARMRWKCFTLSASSEGVSSFSFSLCCIMSGKKYALQHELWSGSGSLAWRVV